MPSAISPATCTLVTPTCTPTCPWTRALSATAWGWTRPTSLPEANRSTSTNAGPVRLSRPLDFLVVADHSDNMGFFPDLFAGKAFILEDPTGKNWYDMIKAGQGVDVAIELIGLFSQGKFPEALTYKPDSAPYRAAWDKTVAAAERYNQPGVFTAFIGYEWTSLVQGNNLHRVVVYRDGGDKGGQMVPYTTVAPQGSTNPRDLWKWLASYEKKTGGDVLAIAHNGNLSNGIMFPIHEQYDGKQLDVEYVTQRASWEPLYEATQIKGDGETHPFLSPNDEFAAYENWDIGNLDVSEAKTDAMLSGEYAREALKRGLELEAKLGTNPYKFGMIGSTDSHTSLATAAGKQLLRQARGCGALAGTHDAPLHGQRERRHHGLAAGGLWPGRGVGEGEYPRGPV